MADEVSSEGGSGILVALVGAVLAVAFFVPAVGEVIFQWMPATVSVITGAEMADDVRNVPRSEKEKEITVALKPVQERNVLLAQAATAFDTAVNRNDAYENPSPVVAQISEWWENLVPISIFISLMLFVGILYAFIQLMRIRAIEQVVFDVAANPILGGDVTKTQLRWQKIIEHANTNNPNDWRQAIIEADIMLDELLTVQGYRGDTVGDKLKQVEKSDFNSIDLAWEAHKVRNNIAHQGSEHDLNPREIRRVIQLYEHVFHEFRYI